MSAVRARWKYLVSEIYLMEQTNKTYARLIALLEEGGTSYRLLDHASEGRTEIVSTLRGHSVEQAAKCIIVMVKFGKKVTKFVLAVLPGNARLDLTAVRGLYPGATYAGFAPPERAEQLAGSVIGTVLPFGQSSTCGHFGAALRFVMHNATCG